MRHFSVFLENKVGALLEVVKLLGDHSVVVLALSIQDSAESSICRFIVSDPDRVEALFEENGIPFSVSEVVVTELKEGAMDLAKVLAALLKAEVNILFSYPLLSRPAVVPCSRCTSMTTNAPPRCCAATASRSLRNPTFPDDDEALFFSPVAARGGACCPRGTRARTGSRSKRRPDGGKDEDDDLDLRRQGAHRRGDQFSSIANVKTGEVTSLIHPQKVAMQLPKGAMDEIRKHTEKSLSKPNLKPTGRTETISGYKCEEYTGTLGGMELTYWVTKDVPDYQSIRDQLAKVSGSSDPFKKALGDGSDLPGVPGRTVVKSPSMGSSTMTLVSIKSQDVPASKFTVPDGYKSMAVPSVMPAPGAVGD